MTSFQEKLEIEKLIEQWIQGRRRR
ncbi:hypothetical protein F383_32537 [Gossypium arboreum]|uniref:Uncharacterized protein n=1 Tax=Gossypium arboreum TaxID=29729 RepID=A0A0B0PL39_GOSAR|nr:hypothetical protein F383_32537 [Gossypium arboreum]